MVYENVQAKTVGKISVTANISAGFNTGISTIHGTAPLNTAMWGTLSHDSSEDGFSIQITCKQERGEKYYNGYVILSPSPAMKQILSSLLSKPGQTPTQAEFSHKILFFFRAEAEKELEICCFRGLLLVLAGLFGAADYVSTLIATDGFSYIDGTILILPTGTGFR